MTNSDVIDVKIPTSIGPIWLKQWKHFCYYIDLGW